MESFWSETRADFDKTVLNTNKTQTSYHIYYNTCTGICSLRQNKRNNINIYIYHLDLIR